MEMDDRGDLKIKDKKLEESFKEDKKVIKEDKK